MPSVAPTLTTTLPDNLRRLGLAHTADDLNDLVARATQKRWSPIVLLETLAQAELDARVRRRVALISATRGAFFCFFASSVGLLPDGLDERIRAEAMARIEDAVAFAEAAPMPDPEDALTGVYSDRVEEGWPWRS